MTPAELRRILERHGLTQVGAAEALGITDRQMRRYVAGDRPVPVMLDYALRWMTQKGTAAK
jgi:transcriptional regulator with XRE-family HTH domain